MNLKQLIMTALVAAAIVPSQSNADGIASDLIITTPGFIGCDKEVLARTRTVPTYFLTHYMFTSLYFRMLKGSGELDHRSYQDIEGKGYALQTLTDEYDGSVFNLSVKTAVADSNHIALACRGFKVIEYEQFRTAESNC